MIVNWGKPKIWVKDLDDDKSQWVEVPTPVEDSTELTTTEGDKLEAKIEGGENEDVRVKRSTYEFAFNIRKTKGRTAPIESVDGVVEHNFALMLQPEDPACVGFSIEKANVSVLDTYTAADGSAWQYKFSALKPDNGSQIKWGVVTETQGTPSIATS